VLFVFGVIFITGFFLQDISRKGVFFGVRLPEKYYKEEPFAGLKRKYRTNFTITCLAYFLVFGVLIYFIQNPGLFILGILGAAVILNVNYYYIYFKAKKLKNNGNYQIPTRNIVVVDTDFRSDRIKRSRVSKLWFLIPAVLAVLSAVISLIFYDKAPDMIPHHWGITGQADAWSPKSNWTVLSMPVMMMVFTVIMYVSYSMIGKSKPSFDPENLGESRERNRIFRYVWSAFYVILSIFLSLLFILLHLGSLELITVTPTAVIILSLPLFIAAIASIVLSIIMGQGGSRIKIVEDERTENRTIDREDDKYWILGDFYYNPDDPLLFVEKRMGVGWDFNYARPMAKVLIAAIALLIIGVIVMSIIMMIH
jgi:uncharacterized membrane protein